ncbi:uncharacterized protein SRS1_14805 [Sporisorium reilianum f. sp. reilianum]|uniref:Uncharacterized protein n=1 Tax=Sporisorium reilianum f. sp. reilianum TaxID=72559 RepID=A0A2N8UH28_9BASI|nr:uncharacterized protein SRS1_14805 [Sporisorium reilianum f. sp. reilianum]
MMNNLVEAAAAAAVVVVVGVKTEQSTSASLQRTVEVIVISDDEDDEERVASHPAASAVSTTVAASAAAAVAAATPQDDNDDNDDGIEYVGSAGPMSATLNALPRKPPTNLTRYVTSAMRSAHGKRRATEHSAPSSGKRVKRVAVQSRTVARVSSAAGASTAAVEGIKAEARLELVRARALATPSPERRVSEWTTSAAEWRPPTPPRSPPRSSTSSAHRFECTIARRAPGAKPYDTQDIWVDPSFDLSAVPFGIKEIPSFERGSWLGLGTHRYVVVSPLYPRTPAEERACAVGIKTQLLALFGMRAWAGGEEPEVSFPAIEAAEHDFVDIRLFRGEQHELARDPGAALRLATECFTPFVHAAFVDPRHWLLLQFSHPSIQKLPDETLTPTDNTHLLTFARAALIALNTLLHPHHTPVALWLLPLGYPHNDTRAAQHNWARKSEYVLLLRRNVAPEGAVRLPSHVEVEHEAGKKVWVKVWWDGREVDLCGYCKSARDGHTNAECPERERRKDGGRVRGVRERPTVY